MMTIRIITILVLLITHFSTLSQNIEKILTDEEIKTFQEKGEIIKYIDTLNRNKYGGLTGNLRLNKTGKTYCETMIGEWRSDNYKKNSDAIMCFDSLGRLLWYKEYNKDKVIIFDCIYNYEIRNEILYRIEKHIVRYDNGNVYIAGNRYLKLKRNKKCPNYKTISTQKKFGIYNFYYEDGSIMKTKDYGIIK